MKKSVNKNYHYSLSPFYRVGTKRKLAEILNLSVLQLSQLQNSESKYYIKEILVEDKDPRVAQVPFGLKRLVHERIKDLLCRIETPSYLKSSKKGSFILNNAKEHLDSNYLRKMDIAKFYPSCKQYHVYEFFLKKMEMTRDVAYIISQICVYKDFLPTGSPLSQILAYFIHQETFDEIQQLSISSNCIFTLWVDDLVISSNEKIPASLITDIKGKLRVNGLKTKKKKEKKYLPDQHKLVTGVILTKDKKIDVNNNARNKIHTILRDRDLSDLTETELRKLHGIISQGRQLNKEFMTKLFSQTSKQLKSKLTAKK